MPDAVSFTVNGRVVEVPADGGSLLDALRDHLGLRAAKDGCSPQGQCGCCTVWVDGSARVACVTPVARVAGRNVTTLEGISERAREEWGRAMCAAGGSQCGFCTPGIVMRLEALRTSGATTPAVRQSLLAHLCRCTGWQTIVEAWDLVGGSGVPERDLGLAARRAELEGGVAQVVSPDIALGLGGFADDIAPPDALAAALGPDGQWHVAETPVDARRAAANVPGRRTTAALIWPIDVPAGDWVRTLRTTWVEPSYLEPDASWCRPGDEPVTLLANGGAFGGKAASEVGATARRLAHEHGRPVRVMYSREDVVRLGPKRPPMAIGVRADGSGVVRVARTSGIASAMESAGGASLLVEEVDIAGPATSSALRAAGWAEVAVVLASLADGPDVVVAPSGGWASAIVDEDGIHATVRAGRPLDEVVLRSYCIGAAHMGYGWVTSEGLSVDTDGVVHDLTIRSFGIVRAVDMPAVHVTIEPDDRQPLNASDAVFAAVAAATWRHLGYPPAWPTR